MRRADDQIIDSHGSREIKDGARGVLTHGVNGEHTDVAFLALLHHG